jgi:hypothetical protein
VTNSFIYAASPPAAGGHPSWTPFGPGGSPHHAKILTFGRICNRDCGVGDDRGGTGPWGEQGADDQGAERWNVRAERRWIDGAEGRRIVRARSIEQQDDWRRRDQNDEDDWFRIAWWVEEVDNHHRFNVYRYVDRFGLWHDLGHRHHDRHHHDRHHDHDGDDVRAQRHLDQDLEES